jgi:hypothetical protein
MTVTDVANLPGSATRRRIWPWAVVVVGVVLVVIAVTAVMHLRGQSSELRQTITVAGREYRAPVVVTATQAMSGSGTWTQVGTVLSSGAPVYASQIDGAAPTAVFVPASNSEYTQYTLVGGP